ncbi:MAG: 23S rRNA (guanosine(2251)-2'-O)-methyltransferase RlmB [Acidobacteria bacterium]|nr:23S rRNA (guanosine(2251)-2'-O)-methyltransferase RlmB [Acidobacteriota bacterium]
MSEGAALVYGLQPVRNLLEEGGPVERIVVSRGQHGAGLRSIVEGARRRGIPVRQEERRQLDRLAGHGAHQGVVAWTAVLPYHDAAGVLAAVTPPALLLVLDGVQDPRNLGALLRTAAAAGVQGVFIPRRGAVGLTATVIKASAGLAGRVPVARVGNLARFLEDLKARGIWVIGLEAAGKPLWGAFDLTQPVALVMGGEGGGLRPLLRRKCDVRLALPMVAGIDSLNVSVAFGIACYEVLRQRRSPE